MIDRKKLGDIVFNDSDKMEVFNQIIQESIYDYIMDELAHLKRENHPLVILDIPLLFEMGYDADVDQTMVVYTSPSVQLERLMSRDNVTEKEALSRISAQLSIEDKVEYADVVINNNGSISESEDQVNVWLEENGY